MPGPFHLFEAFGVELEYMIVDRAALRVLPICDQLLSEAARLPGAEAEYEDGSAVPTEVSLGPVSWSNELVAHVVEFKTTDPAPSLAGLAPLFQDSVGRANTMLAPLGAMLLPTAMHPTMDPHREMKLWAHGYSDVYAAFNRIFDCRGHGWANLQAAHLNLPFAGDDEFGRLHAAIRALLPIMPALAASSPMIEGGLTGLLDSRMDVYRSNSRRVPSVAGRVIPEPAFTEGAYRRDILEKIYADMAPMDPEGVLRDEWCNSRGCIARFSRGSIEVRVLDVQECPAADLAICAALESVLRELAAGPQESLRALDTAALHAVLLRVIKDADEAPVDYPELPRALGIDPPPTAGAIWRALIDRARLRTPSPALETASQIVSRGALARRIVRALGDRPTPDRIGAVYRRLASCLSEGRLFEDTPAGAERL